MAIHRSIHSARRTRGALRIACVALGMFVVATGSALVSAPAASADVPVVVITTPADGAHYALGQAVYADYRCSYPGYQITSCVGNVPVGAAIDTSSVGTHTFTVKATVLSAFPLPGTFVTNTYTVDPVSPTVQIDTPKEGAVYLRGHLPVAAYHCTPGSLALKSCVGTDSWVKDNKTVRVNINNGLTIPSMPIGAHTFTVVATDSNGTTTTGTTHYRISSAHLPDAIINGIGNNIYGDVLAETYSTRTNHKAVTLPIAIQNDGTRTEAFKVKGEGSTLTSIRLLPHTPPAVVPSWLISYYDRLCTSGGSCHYRDITKSVVAGTYTSATLAPGQSQTIRMVATPTPWAVTASRTIKVWSPADPATEDDVRAILNPAAVIVPRPPVIRP